MHVISNWSSFWKIANRKIHFDLQEYMFIQHNRTFTPSCKHVYHVGWTGNNSKGHSFWRLPGLLLCVYLLYSAFCIVILFISCLTNIIFLWNFQYSVLLFLTYNVLLYSPINTGILFDVRSFALELGNYSDLKTIIVSDSQLWNNLSVYIISSASDLIALICIHFP